MYKSIQYQLSNLNRRMLNAHLTWMIMLGLAAQAIRHNTTSSGSGGRASLVLREKSDLCSRSKYEVGSRRVNEAAPRGPQDRLGSLSRAISVDAYPEGQLLPCIFNNRDFHLCVLFHPKYIEIVACFPFPEPHSLKCQN